MVGLWICQHYFEESTWKVEKVANNWGITTELIGSTASIRYKSIKPSNAIICDVFELKGWCEVESIVNHITKSKFNSIHADLKMKYSSMHIVNDAFDEEHWDNSVSHIGDDIPVIKCAPKVCVE